MKPFTLPLSDSQATLETIGGKGMWPTLKAGQQEIIINVRGQEEK